MAMMFARIARRPMSDLRRKYSYSMGEFGNEAQAHEGLSGYGGDLEKSLEALRERMGLVGFPRRTYVAVYEGRYVGRGPDGEDLFVPSHLVCAIDTRASSREDEMIQKVLAAVAGGRRWVGRKG